MDTRSLFRSKRVLPAQYHELPTVYYHVPPSAYCDCRSCADSCRFMWVRVRVRVLNPRPDLNLGDQIKRRYRPLYRCASIETALLEYERHDHYRNREPPTSAAWVVGFRPRTDNRDPGTSRPINRPDQMFKNWS